MRGAGPRNLFLILPKFGVVYFTEIYCHVARLIFEWCIRLTCVKPRVCVQPVQCREGRIAAGHVTHERLLLGVDPRVHLQAGESRLRD